MDRITRATRAAERTEEHARNLRTAALRKLGPASAELHELAARYERTAARWRSIAAEERPAPVKECCDAPEDETCQPECACPPCEVERALDEDADRFADYA